MTTLFIVGSSIAGLNMFNAELFFIDNRNYPFGPSTFTMKSGLPSSQICTVITVVGTWLVDALLVRFSAVHLHSTEFLVCAGLPLLCHIATQAVDHDYSLRHVPRLYQ